MDLDRIELTIQDLRGYRQVMLTACRMNELATLHWPEPLFTHDGPNAVSPGQGSLNGTSGSHPAATIAPARGHKHGYDLGLHHSDLARRLKPLA
jgi:hypothetical protein